MGHLSGADAAWRLGPLRRSGGTGERAVSKPPSKFPDLALVLANLQILCEDCNLGKMARDQTDWRPMLNESPEMVEEQLRSLSE